MNDTPHKTGTSGQTPFWVTRRGARIALIAIHAIALIAIAVEFVRPASAPAGYTPDRVLELEFIGSYAIYGFVACVLLVLLGLVLRRLMMREENYYGDDAS